MTAITPTAITGAEYADLVDGAFVDERLVGDGATHIVVVDSDDPALPAPGSLPLVVVAHGARSGDPGPAWADVVLAESDLADVTSRVLSHPLAATSLAVHMRTVGHVAPASGLALESAVYSTLQAGPEFARWRADATHRPVDDVGPTVLSERSDDTLVVTLHRPHRHNAISRRLRDDLVDALRPALADDSIRGVVLRGDGPSFCSGGDLGEFGERPDPATAHVIRLARSPARMLLAVGPRTTARIHGTTAGGGIELAAFARHVEAHRDTAIALPELDLGLIPGAGGTVSITRRVGRQRAMALAITCRAIDTDVALLWGLIDSVAAPP